MATRKNARKSAGRKIKKAARRVARSSRRAGRSLRAGGSSRIKLGRSRNVSRDRMFMSKAEKERYERSGRGRKTSYKTYKSRNDLGRKIKHIIGGR